MTRLRVTSGPLTGTTVDIAEELLIGRVDAGLVLDDAEVSRRHARIRKVGSALEIEDLGSSNGTFVDGARIDGPTSLGAGAQLRFGATELVVEGVLADATRISKRPDPQATMVASARVAEPERTLARQAPAPVPEPAREPIGQFAPPGRRRRRGLASRSWIPVVLSFGTVIATAIALVLYFAMR
jgi:pSer/pThr/pTyr-binding forkhead associated (FHA) protein